jgi:hypothetical protein
MSDYPTPVDSTTGLSRWAKDAAERVVRVFVFTFLSTFIASGPLTVDTLTDVSGWQRAGLAAVAAVLSLVTSTIAKFVGRKDSAGLTV